MKLLQTSLLLLFAASCSGCVGLVSGTKPPANPPPAESAVKVSVTPGTANIRAGESYTFSATVTGTANAAVTWSVNGTSGGSSSLGTINSTGKYTAPPSLPSPNSLTIRATSTASSTVSATSTATILNATPVLTGINPASVGTGNFTLTVTGSKFASGAHVSLSGLALETTYVSATQLTAKGSASSAGTFPVTVTNPDPGASTSSGTSLAVTGSTQASSCSSMQTGPGAALGGFVPFPADSLWNKDISAAAVDANSAATINYIGGTAAVHADFGAGQYQGSTMGIPYVVVGSSQALATVNLTDYADESDPGPMPIPASANIEGYPNPGSGDRHVLVLDNANCFLYELYNSSVSGTTWSASSTAVWDLLANEQRPYGWTSADAAGLPIFPGLLRYDEVAAGHINHAIRFTLQHSKAAFVLPATHWASNTSNAAAAPMGMRVRLKASFDVSSYSAANKVILAAMKKYGMIMADNGSNMYISGAPDDRWNNDDLHALGNLKAADFEVLTAPTTYTAANIPTGSAPHIASLSATATSVASGTQVTLSWQATGATYVIVSPGAGAVRGTSVVVTPTQTTTYTLYATNAFGRTKSTLTVTVH
ncbi:MAG TPA: IPT/TIG domain-containing protein [Candidatus Saccharimonadales bacterium]|nr:IPT/TIG domain-containing protein [Candidatus Saccharimonadales bacterium]